MPSDDTLARRRLRENFNVPLPHFGSGRRPIAIQDRRQRDGTLVMAIPQSGAPYTLAIDCVQAHTCKLGQPAGYFVSFPGRLMNKIRSIPHVCFASYRGVDDENVLKNPDGWRLRKSAGKMLARD